MLNYKKIYVAFRVGLISVSMFAQLPGMPVMPSPPSPSMPNYGLGGTADSGISRSSFHYHSNHHSGMDMYERDRMEVHHRNQAVMQEIEEIDMWRREQELTHYLIENGFPRQSAYPDRVSFINAYKELSNMLDGSLPLSIGRALYLTENAFYQGELDQDDFQKEIAERVQLCQWRMKELNLDDKDNMALNMVIWSFLCDTLQIKEPGSENRVTHYPAEYNYEDYQSKIDYTSHFISTLMKTNKGNCHSMPLLYLVMAEQLGAEAYLSYAPLHSFIKIQDEEGKWYNMEITNRYILSDAHYMNHSYVKSGAIKSKIYMNPLTKKEVIAAMMA